jgi:hypothetical protein
VVIAAVGEHDVGLLAGPADLAGIDWGTRRAAWCALSAGGELTEGAISADDGGLTRLVARLGPEVRGCIEMMSGAVWVGDRLAECGWAIEIADARSSYRLKDRDLARATPTDS